MLATGLVALAVSAPQTAGAQSDTGFAVAGHGILVATGSADLEVRVDVDDDLGMFEIPSPEDLRVSGGVGGRFEILPVPQFSTGLQVSYARQRTSEETDHSWRDVDLWLAARLPAEVGARGVSVVPYVAAPVGLSILVGRLPSSSDERRLGWNLSALLGVEVEATKGFALYLEGGWLMRQARSSGDSAFGDYRLTFTTHQFVLHLGLRGSRSR